MTSRTARSLTATAVLAAVMWGGTVGAASAATPDPDKTSSSDLTVSVPAATPAPTPPPWNPPPNNNPPGTDAPPANNGGGTTGGATPPRAGGGGGGGAAPAAPPAEPGPATEPPIGDAPSTGETFTTDKEHYVFGENVSISMGGFTPGEQVQIVLFPGGTLIGNVAAGPDGTLIHTFALPNDLAPGTYTVQLTGWQSKRVGTAEIFVTGAAAAVESVGMQGVPWWAWWAAGGLGAVLLAAGGVWVIRAMRAAPAAAPSAEAVA